jgi:hypothetical protein
MGHIWPLGFPQTASALMCMCHALVDRLFAKYQECVNGIEIGATCLQGSRGYPSFR